MIPWLSICWLVPVGAAILVLLLPRGAAAMSRLLTVAATAVTAGVVWGMVIVFAQKAPSAGRLPMRFTEHADWLSAIGAGYHIGIDGVSAWLLALNAGLFLVGALLIRRGDFQNVKLYCSLLLLTEAATTGVLISLDLLLFYFFWEAMLVPLYFLLANYGGANRLRATLKFVIYTVAGSFFMLLAIIYLYLHAGGHSFDIQTLLAATGDGGRISILGIPTFTPQEWAFLAFALAFAIKVPLVPFHTWQPDLYESCPPQALVFFAGIVSKLGAFGFIRYGITLFPHAAGTFKWFMAALAVASIIYGAAMALSERDLKRIVAYASISHLGFIVLGIFTLNSNGINGAVIQMVNHGIIIAALFMIVWFVEEKAGTRDLLAIAGLEKRMPVLYGLFLVITLAALGMPGMSSFAGEFSIMLGAFQLHWIFAVLAGGGVILAAWYMLRLHQGLMHDSVSQSLVQLRDISAAQAWILVPLAALMIYLGAYPQPLASLASPAVSQYLQVTHAGDGR